MLTQWRARRSGLGMAKIQHDLREIVNADYQRSVIDRGTPTASTSKR